MVASAVLFPIVIFSSIRFSNRFVGPMVRVRKTLHQLAQGETTPIRAFRQNDFWSDTVDDINEIAALHKHGITDIRLGKQACFYTYPGPDTLLEKITSTVSLRTLHIDNVIPGMVL